jgi:hypothetical protein
VAAALPCGGPACQVTLRFVGADGAALPRPAAEGECAVDREGEVYRREGRNRLDNMPLTAPDRLEAYDGDPTYVPPVEESS